MIQYKQGQCETTISGHSDSIECVKWGGSGLLYSCSRDRTIKGTHGLSILFQCVLPPSSLFSLLSLLPPLLSLLSLLFPIVRPIPDPTSLPSFITSVRPKLYINIPPIRSNTSQFLRNFHFHNFLAETILIFFFFFFSPLSSYFSNSLFSTSPLISSPVWAVDGSGRSMHKLVRTLTGHAHRINSLALNCDYVLRTGAFQIGEGGRN